MTLPLSAINGALRLLPAAMDTSRARVSMYAIGWQESRFKARFQVVQGKPGKKGPARGFWQFERPTVGLVIRHKASRFWLNALCESQGVRFESAAIWSAIETNDVLAAGLARLLIFTDAAKLPAVGEKSETWDLYARVWRPGKPHPQTWDDAYAFALEEFQR